MNLLFSIGCEVSTGATEKPGRRGSTASGTLRGALNLPRFDRRSLIFVAALGFRVCVFVAALGPSRRTGRPSIRLARRSLGAENVPVQLSARGPPAPRKSLPPPPERRMLIASAL